MKRLLYILFFAAFAFVLVNCEEVDDDFDIGATSLPGYVEFAEEDTLTIAEAQSTTIEFTRPYSNGESAIITYQIQSNGAVYGVDYVIDDEGINADGTNGTVTIVYVDSVENADSYELSVIAPYDGVVDETKYITFTILSAKTASGEELTFGNAQQTSQLTVEIQHSDCPTSLAGTYSSLTTGTSTDGCPSPATVTDLEGTVVLTGVGPGLYQVDDIFAGIYKEWYADCEYGYNGSKVAANISYCLEADGLSLVTFVEVFGSNVVDTGSSYDAETGVITYSWQNGYGDAATTVLTPQ